MNKNNEASGSAALFTYGTLQLAAVMLALTEKDFKHSPASVHGFQRYRMKGKSYPALVDEPGGVVEGTLFTAIDSESMRLLDAFEDCEYERRSIEVVPADGTGLSAWAYIVPAAGLAAVEYEPWDLAAFAQDVLDEYVANCKRFREKFLAGGGSEE